MKVKATDEFKKRGLHPEELENIPEVGFEFEVSEERFKVLSGMNRYGAKFVEVVEKCKEDSEKTEELKEKTSKIKDNSKEVETAVKKIKTEKAVKKTIKKAK